MGSLSRRFKRNKIQEKYGFRTTIKRLKEKKRLEDEQQKKVEERRKQMEGLVEMEKKLTGKG